MQTLNLPTDKAQDRQPQLPKSGRWRAVVEFFVFLCLGMLLAEPILTAAGVSNDSTRRGAFCTRGTKKSVKEFSPRETYRHLALFLQSKKNPEIVMIGSSVTLWPTIASDGYGTPNRPDFTGKFNWKLYRKAEYFRGLLETKLNTTIQDLTCIGISLTSMDDHNLIYTKLLSQNKSPKLVIACIHPSQFFRTQTALREYRQAALELSVLEPEKRSCAIEILKDRLCINLVSTMQKLVIAYIHSAPKGQHEALFSKSLYTPFDPQALHLGFEKLEEMAQSAREHGIPLLVVDMPMTARHRALIGKPLAEYQKRVAEISSTNAARYYDINKLYKFSNEDFVDSLHMNGRGGRKLFAALTDIISKDSDLNRQLCSGRGQISLSPNATSQN